VVSTNANRSHVIPRSWRDTSNGFLREPANSWQNRRQASTLSARMGNVRTIPDITGLLIFRTFKKSPKKLIYRFLEFFLESEECFTLPRLAGIIALSASGGLTSWLRVARSMEETIPLPLSFEDGLTFN
jgi:hypothetical protein